MMSRWEKALRSVLREREDDGATFGELRFTLSYLHSQRWRRYHNLAHLESLLHDIEQQSLRSDPPENPWALLLAVLFHDAVYVPGQGGNERASALLMASWGLVDSTEAARLIALTEKHNPAPGDVDGILLCDADLYPLGVPDLYLRNARLVREESDAYLHSLGLPALTETEWRVNRKAWIENVLARDRIYHGEEMEEHEAQARENLTEELTALQPVLH